MASKGFGGYDVWSEIDGKWSVSPDSLEWNTDVPVKPGAMAKLGFTITSQDDKFELSYVLRRDPTFEQFDTIELAMSSAEELVNLARAGK